TRPPERRSALKNFFGVERLPTPSSTRLTCTPARALSVSASTIRCAISPFSGKLELHAVHYFIDEGTWIQRRRMLRLFVKTDRYRTYARKAGKLILCDSQQLTERCRKRFAREQKNGAGHRGERVIDFVRHGCNHLAGGS